MLLLTFFAGMSAALALALNYFVVFPRVTGAPQRPEPTPGERELADRLHRHVTAIASRPHNLDHYPALEAAASYIEQQLSAHGLRPQLHEFVVAGRPVRNIEIVIDPPAPASHGSIVVGAHYDSADASPGANDNGTGVAALLELARRFGEAPRPNCRLRLVFFVNEEQPYGKTEQMGSLRHARALQQAGENVRGMIALETLGYFTDEPGSQRFPPPFGLLYPKVGNFVAFVGLPKARPFLRQCLRAFRETSTFPSIGGVAPGFIDGIDFSDHWSYDQCGFPAMMITDTAPFRNPHYHSTADLPDTVDYVALARITMSLAKMLERMTSTGAR